MKLNLTYIDRKERTSKTGKPFTSITIKAKEYNDKFLSGFGNKENSTWQVGQEVEVADVKEVSKDDKIYLNFEMPKFGGNSDVMKALEEIKNTLTKIKLDQAQGLKEIYEAVVSGKPKESDYPTGPEKTAFDDDLGFNEEEYPEVK